MNLPDLAVRRPVLVTVFFMILTLLGAISFNLLPVDLMPDIALPTISVSTTYRGVDPQQMEELVTIPLERALSAVPGLKEMTSESSEGASRITLSFDWGTNLEAASEEVRASIGRNREELPRDADPSRVWKFDINSFPIMILGVFGEMNPRELREFLDKQVRYRFERIPGVAQADLWGGLKRQIHVRLDQEKINALRISPNQVLAALRRENLNEPAGQVLEGGFELLMRTEGQYRSMDEIRQTMVARRGGRPIYLTDIAAVEDSYEEVRNLIRINGKPGLRMSVRKTPGANTVQISEAVRAEIERINTEVPQIDVSVTYDSAEFIEQAVSNVRNAAVYGAMLAVLVLLLFLRNLRSTFVVALSIPISVIGTFGLMYFYDFSLNIVTFGGLALGVGVLLDNAIVVLENIFRHRQEGMDKNEAAVVGTREVGQAITASTMTTIVVFIPVVFMSGLAGAMFQQLAWVVAFALFSSLLVSLTMVPLLSSRFVRVREPDPGTWTYPMVHAMRLWLRQLDVSYANAIDWALHHKTVVVMLTVLIVSGGALLVPYVGYELQPETDEGEIRVTLELAEGTRLEITDDVARAGEEILWREVPEIDNLLTEVGNEGGWRTANTNSVNFRITLVPEAERTRSSQEIAAALRPQFQNFAGVHGRSNPGGGNLVMRIAQRGQGDDVEVHVRGYDQAAAYALAVEIRRLLEETEGVADAKVNRSTGRAENHITIDRARAAQMGLSVSEIATTLRAAIGGTVATYYREAGEEYEILVRFREEDRVGSSDVQAIPIQTPNGGTVPLGSVVMFDRREGPIKIDRKDQQRIISVGGNLTGTRDVGSVVAELQGRIRTLAIPDGLAVLFAGQWEEQEEAFFYLQIGLLLSVVLVYLVLAAQFESFKYPFLIMFSLPVASVGVVLVLFLTDTTLSIQSFIGIIMLVGIVVNNGIVLIDYVLQLRRIHGFSVHDALVTGGRRRLRPILMTSLTTVLGLTPMALGLGEGGELQAPMARVLIGGLVSSTLITLFLIPTLFMVMESIRLRRTTSETVPSSAVESV